MKQRHALILAASALMSAPAFAELEVSLSPLPTPAFPSFADGKAVDQACDAGLKALNGEVAQLARRKVDKGWLAAYDLVIAHHEDARFPIDFVQNVHADKSVRDAAQACALRWTDFQTALTQNEKIYRGLKTAPAADAIDRELKRNALGLFEDSGVGLSKDKRARAKEILDRLSALDQQFSKAIRDANIRVAFTAEELRGVPDGVWKDKSRDDQGRYLLGVDNPTYTALMQTAESGAARERIWRAKTNEGGEGNLQLLTEIITLRKEYAGLFGYDNYVDFNLRRQMAKDAATATRFLREVKGTVQQGERADLEELRRAKAAHLGTAVEATTVTQWDGVYYAERIRKQRFTVDQEDFRPYFPPAESLAFTLRVVDRLLGVTHTPVSVPGLWHPDVKAYVVRDGSSGRSLGTLYVDPFPRDGKYNHAAVWPLRSSSTRLGRAPAAALVVNLDRGGLSLDELETLLHELGHAVHNNLSTTRDVSLGQWAVMHDFVEAPSQMLEDWVYDPKVLKLMAEVCPSCKPVPDELVGKAREARDFAKGTKFGRQHLYASYDLALHGATIQDPLALWAKMEGDTPLGHVPGTMFPSRFAHIAGSYGAGYYGYLWSLVVAMDLRTPFAADKLDAAVGRRYRNAVLSRGAEKPAPALVRDFLGRDSNANAFYNYLRK